MSLTLLHRPSAEVVESAEGDVQGWKLPRINWGALQISYTLGVLFRRLALIAFLETLIATYLVHRSEVVSSVAPTNFGAVLVLLVGFFVTIVLCAASIAFSNT